MRNIYHQKINKKAFLYPDQWKKFYDSVKEKQQPYFKIAINTGGRINEIRNLKVKDIDFERKSLTFYVTKVRAKLKETRPTPRTIPISTEFRDWLQRYVRKYKLKLNDTFNIPSTVGIDKFIKKRCALLEFKDPEDYSSHNFRKTHGNWLKAMGVDGIEIAGRLGHDADTMLKHYVSPSLFNQNDLALIKQELGDLYIDIRRER